MLSHVCNHLHHRRVFLCLIACRAVYSCGRCGVIMCCHHVIMRSDLYTNLLSLCHVLARKEYNMPLRFGVISFFHVELGGEVIFARSCQTCLLSLFFCRSAIFFSLRPAADCCVLFVGSPMFVFRFFCVCGKEGLRDDVSKRGT
mgnify:CR=1 FL=1